VGKSPHFHSFFLELRDLLQQKRDDSRKELSNFTAESAMSSPSNKRPLSMIEHESRLKPRLVSPAQTAEEDISQPSANIFTDPKHSPQTPANQSTVSKDPKYSGDSSESTAEINTKKMMTQLITMTFSLFETSLSQVRWPTFAQACRLKVDAYRSESTPAYL